jgi:ribosome-associated heat shock protein Hsp15
MDSIRCDKWLWAARFFKTRALAQQAIEKGRVLISGERIKPARAVKTGDLVSISQGDWMREVTVLGLSDVRGPAPVAQTLYAETPNSMAARDKAREQRTLYVEPAASIKGRPSKRDRRALERTQRSE